MNTDSYAGRHAELYDLFYQEKAYAEEASAIRGLLAHAGIEPPASLLDVACGTGSHALEFDRLGFRVTAVDHSDAMLAIARRRAAVADRPISFVRQDMRSLELDERTFDAAVCLFDSIGYARTNEGVASTLEGLRRHLRPGGALIVEYWHAAAMLRQYEPVRTRSWDVDGTEVLRISETRLMPEQQLAEVAYRVLELRPDGTYNSLQEVQTNRYFLVPDMEDRLDHAGFDVLGSQAGFDGGAVDLSTWHVVTLARRRP